MTKSQIEMIVSGKAHNFETGGFSLWEDLHYVLDVQLLTSMEVGWTIHGGGMDHPRERVLGPGMDELGQ